MAHFLTERVIIGGLDFSDTDPEARQIMVLLADHPTMPVREDRPMPPVRVLINLILQAHKATGIQRTTRGNEAGGGR
jgi:hypothetical protein